jgi:hypothetical protein
MLFGLVCQNVFGRLPQDLCLLTTGAQKLFIGYNEEIKKKLLEPAMEIELLFGIYDMNNQAIEMRKAHLIGRGLLLWMHDG